MAAQRQAIRMAFGPATRVTAAALPVVSGENTPAQLVTQLVDEEEDAKSETWAQWFWRHKWKFLAAGLTIAAIYLLYKKYGGLDVPKPTPTDTPPPDIGLESPQPGQEVNINNNNAPPVESPGVEPEPEVFHAWPPGKEYSIVDKIKSITSIFPGGGLVVEVLEQLYKKEPDGPALLAELLKVHPAMWPMGVYDSLAQAISYYSEGKIEIGQFKKLVADIIKTGFPESPKPG